MGEGRPAREIRIRYNTWCAKIRTYNDSYRDATQRKLNQILNTGYQKITKQYSAPTHFCPDNQY